VWFVLSNAKTIWNRTEDYREVPQVKGAGADCAFGQAYKTGPSGQRVVLISKRVLSELLMEKKEKYNQEKQLMKLDDLTLVLWPVQGEKGWKDYKTMAEQQAFVPVKKVQHTPATQTSFSQCSTECALTTVHALFVRLSTCASVRRSPSRTSRSDRLC
jgi:hypothetical protein